MDSPTSVSGQPLARRVFTELDITFLQASNWPFVFQGYVQLQEHGVLGSNLGFVHRQRLPPTNATSKLSTPSPLVLLACLIERYQTSPSLSQHVGPYV